MKCPRTTRPVPALALLALLALPAPVHAATTPGTGTDTSTVAAVPPPAPLFVDPSDMGLGVSMVYRRVPNAADIAALAYYDNVQHLVLALPAWPEDYSVIEPLAKLLLPQGTDVIVILPGYPPTRSQAALWNMVRQPLRIIMAVDGPPADRGLLMELNAMRGLERVIATMEHPARTGFERLQRPLTFRVLMP